MKRYAFLVIALCLGMSRAWAYPLTSYPATGFFASIGYYMPTVSSAITAGGATVNHFTGGPCLTLGDLFASHNRHAMGVELSINAANISSSTSAGNTKCGGNSCGGNGWNGNNWDGNDSPDVGNNADMDIDWGNIVITRLLVINQYQCRKSLFMEYGVGVCYISSSSSSVSSTAQFDCRAGLGVRFGGDVISGFLRVDYDPSFATANIERDISGGVTGTIGLVF